MRVSLFVRLFASMNFSSFSMFSTYMCVSFCVSEYVHLFVWLLPCSGHCIIFTVIVSFDFVIQPLFSSIIIHYFLFHFFIRSLGENFFYFIFFQDIEFERHGLPLPVRCMGKSFKVSIYYFVFLFFVVLFCKGKPFVSVCFLSCP